MITCDICGAKCAEAGGARCTDLSSPDVADVCKACWLKYAAACDSFRAEMDRLVKDRRETWLHNLRCDMRGESWT